MIHDKKPYALIKKKAEINKHFDKITVFEKEKLFQKLKDIFYVYGLSIEDVKNFLASSGNLNAYTDQQLLDLEGVANAILFEIKYRRRNFF